MRSKISTSTGERDKFSNGLPGNLVMTAANQAGVGHGFKAMQIAAVQAVDIRGGVGLISSATRPFYHDIRERSPALTSDRPMDKKIEIIARYLVGKE